MYLRSIATATPPRSFTQAQCLELIQTSPKTLARLDRRARLMISTILRGDSGVGARQFALHDPEQLFNADADILNESFRREAPRLAATALGKALARASLRAEDLDLLIVTTCTGYLCPGPSSYIAEITGLRADAWLQDIVGLGCGAAIPAMRSAEAAASSAPELNIACVSVEICSAAFYLDSDPGVVISACLFGDGAAATIWQGRAGKSLVRCHGFDSLHQPESRDLIRFEQREGKLRNLLDAAVPGLAAGAVGALHAKDNLRSARAIGKVLSHAGGRDVIEAIENKLAGHRLHETRQVLKHHGNMSSPSVIFALERALRAGHPPEDKDWWLVSFGAGFSAHSCRISAA